MPVFFLGFYRRIERHHLMWMHLNKQGVERLEQRNRWSASSPFIVRILILNNSIFSVAYKPLSSLDYDVFTPSGEHGWIDSWHSHWHIVNDHNLIPHADVHLHMSISLVDASGLRCCLKPRPYDCNFEFGLCSESTHLTPTSTRVVYAMQPTSPSL